MKSSNMEDVIDARLKHLEPRLGNSPRMLPDARSPAITSFDASVFKNIRFSRDGRRYAQLRVDVINVPNHANFFINPNSSRTFGAYNFNAHHARAHGEQPLSATGSE